MGRRHRMWWLLLAVVVAVPLLPSAVSAQVPTQRIRHIAPGGTDTKVPSCEGGTAERPWATFKHSIKCLAPGETLYVHEGTYTERLAIGNQRGTAEQPIVVTGAPGEDRPVIRGSFRLENADHWTIQDLEITTDGESYADGTHPLKILGGSNWTVQRVEVHSVPTFGLVRITPSVVTGESANDWRFLDSCIHTTIPLNGSPDSAPYPDHNMYVWTGPSSGTGLIEGNVVYGAPNGQNLKLGNTDGGGQTDRVTVRHNTFVDAKQNITIVGDSDDNNVVDNVLAEVGGEPWYPNVRAIFYSGTGSIVQGNAWSGSPYAVHNRTGNTTAVPGANNYEVSPSFEGTGCEGLYPSDSRARSKGAFSPQYTSRRAGELGVDVTTPVERVAGASREETAVGVSRRFWDSSPVALVARMDAYPDALASSALSGRLDAPLLLVGRDDLPEVVAAELGRLGAERVIILGGTSAVSDAVARDIERLGIERVERVLGDDRFDTAAAVADLIAVDGDVAEVILVEGANPDPRRGWPDAVSAGQLAAAATAPVLLTTTGTLPAATQSWLRRNRPDRVTIVGGTVAVSQDVASEVERYVGSVVRISGQDRFETSELVAMEVAARGAGDRSTVIVASGLTFPDALSAGPAAARVGGVLVLYGTGDTSYQRLRGFLGDRQLAPGSVTVVGGARAVTTAIEDRWARELLLHRSSG